MPRPRSFLIAACWACLLALGGPLPGTCRGDATGGEARVVFTGDILLSRQVAAELARKGKSPSPWEGCSSLFRRASLLVGNLEGAVGNPQECAPASANSPCFAVDADVIGLLREAGFDAVSLENNHAMDLGPRGFEATRKALAFHGIVPLCLADAPYFFPLEKVVLGLVPLNLVSASRERQPGTSDRELRQKLRLAARLSHLTVVFVHWGKELTDWPGELEQDTARRLLKHGADAVVGHHPHVIREPRCIEGKPVFFSLGNHLFDQKYPQSKEGMIAQLTIRDGRIWPGAVLTRIPRGSSYPSVVAEPAPGAESISSCSRDLREPLQVDGTGLRPVGPGTGGGFSLGESFIEGTREGKTLWRMKGDGMVSMEAVKLDGPKGPESLFTLERRPSSLDDERGLRPFVYAVSPRGLEARWRGTALSWPLLDAVFLSPEGGILCALHRGDSFLNLDPGSTKTRTAVYRWNGFGFSGIEDPGLQKACEGRFEPLGPDR